MSKMIFPVACGFFATLMTAHPAQESTAVRPDAAGAPLTIERVNEIRKNPYVDESVQTTNGNVVGLFTEIVSNKAGQPVLGVIQAYDNVTRSKQFVPVPWSLFRFDEGNRKIQIQAAAEHLRTAPTYQQNQIAGLAEGPELKKIQQHFGDGMGGGAVAASMGSQSGQGNSSSLSPPATNDAQPSRGSVGIIYILGVLAIVVLGLGYFVRWRA